MSFYAGFSGEEDIVLKQSCSKQVTAFAITKCQSLKPNIKQHLSRRRRKFLLESYLITVLGSFSVCDVGIWALLNCGLFVKQQFFCFSKSLVIAQLIN